VGATGIVSLLEPDADERRWRYWVEFYDEDKMGTHYEEDEEEFYWDDQLESLEQLEVPDDDGPLRDRFDNPVARVPLPPWDRLSDPEVSIEMHVEAPGEQGDRLAERAKAAVSALVPGVEIAAAAERSEKDDHPDCWNLSLELRSARPSREVFEQLVAADDRWDSAQREDCGWWAGLWLVGRVLLAPRSRRAAWRVVRHVGSLECFAYLWPLGDPTCYPIPPHRTARRG
jgi:hypothetical protein